VTDSVSANAAQHIQQAEFMEFSIGALTRVLREVYGGIDSSEKPIEVKLCPNKNYIRKLYQVNGPIKPTSLPFIGYMPTQFEYGRTEFNQQAMRHRGINLGQMQNGQDWLIGHLTPVTITVDVAFIGNSYDQFIKFSKRWLQKHRDLTFAITVTETGHDISIKTVGQESLVAPDLPSEGDNGEMFIYETSLQMNTYTGLIQKLPSVIDIKGQGHIVPTQDAMDPASLTASKTLYNFPMFEVKLTKNTNLEL